MPLIICPGVHDRLLTDHFLQQCDFPSTEIILVFPADRKPAYCPLSILQYLQAHLTPTPDNPLIFISFSAGVVGAIAAAWSWQQLGGNVKAFIALDGWGVPLFGNFPIHRVSHDYFTHWSSALLGQGRDSFYADPPVDHLQLWSHPRTTRGDRVTTHNFLVSRKSTTAAEFIAHLYRQYLGVGVSDK